MSLTVSSRPCGDVLVLTLEGKLIHGDASLNLRRAVNETIQFHYQKYIILDMTEVTCMDSAGLGELLICRRKILENQGSLNLLNPFQLGLEALIKLATEFNIHDCEVDALAEFPGPVY